MMKLIDVTKRIKWHLVAVLFGLSVLAWVVTKPIFADSFAENPPEIVKGATEQGFPYMSGGIGIDEREVMQSWGGAYNLKLSFAEESGTYLSDVKLLIEDETGREMIRTTSNGPWFYVQLPPGTYTIKATFEDETKQIKNLRLSEGGRALRYVHWDIGGEKEAQ